MLKDRQHARHRFPAEFMYWVLSVSLGCSALALPPCCMLHLSQYDAQLHGQVPTPLGACRSSKKKSLGAAVNSLSL